MSPDRPLGGGARHAYRHTWHRHRVHIHGTEHQHIYPDRYNTCWASAKNAILIVEYAIDYRKSGMPVRQAAQEAGHVRFRPIMMTALAFVWCNADAFRNRGRSVKPYIPRSGRVVFGMAVNALIGTLFVPSFWEILQNFRERHLSGLSRQPTPCHNQSHRRTANRRKQSESKPYCKPCQLSPVSVK